ncbi:MAG: H-NS histone family protein [Rhodocyclaceae bacterium]|nr:H-NS histone family protein [Rhodocyclaceae bacterium]
MDLTSLSVIQLRDLQQQIPVELKRRETQEKINLLNEARAFVKARGYALEELLGKESKIKVTSGTKVKVKYRHPENPELEWTGRGRKPKWVEAWLASGFAMDALGV